MRLNNLSVEELYYLGSLLLQAVSIFLQLYQSKKNANSNKDSK